MRQTKYRIKEGAMEKKIEEIDAR
jgi:intergrase/recombinase